MTYKINGREVTLEEFRASRKGAPIQAGDRLTVFTNGFSEFVSPIDGSVIKSKNELRDHEKRHNVVQVGNDLTTKGCHGKTRHESIKHQKGNNDGTASTDH